jgi:hypothetical protein
VSFLEADGVPAPVERVKIEKPEGKIGPLLDFERQAIIEKSEIRRRYPSRVDSLIAHQQFRARMLAARGLPAEPEKPAPVEEIDWQKVMAPLYALRPRRKAGWRLSTRLFAGAMVVLMLYVAGSWLFPQH